MSKTIGIAINLKDMISQICSDSTGDWDTPYEIQSLRSDCTSEAMLKLSEALNDLSKGFIEDNDEGSDSDGYNENFIAAHYAAVIMKQLKESLPPDLLKVLVDFMVVDVKMITATKPD